MNPRTAEVVRNTAETRVRVRVNLDGTGERRLASGVPFLDHMLDQIARHGLIDLEVEASGDLHIDAHHTVEDIGMRSTRIRAEDGSLITVTNSELADKVIRNISRRVSRSDAGTASGNP